MTDEPRESPSTKRIVEFKGFRIDLVIAVCALLVSTLATLASVWQSHVVSQQLSAEVWPYLAINSTSSNDSFRLSVQDFGLGPAIVRDLVVTVDGKPRHDLPSALSLLLGDRRSLALGGHRVGLDFSSLGPGTVIRPGQDQQLFQITGNAVITQRLIAGQSRVDVRVCYCSILDQCWRIALQGENVAPEAATCNLHDPDAVKPFGIDAIKHFIK
jgi:hypothetical protein